VKAGEVLPQALISDHEKLALNADASCALASQAPQRGQRPEATGAFWTPFSQSYLVANILAH
jgi:hypothetical protein